MASREHAFLAEYAQAKLDALDAGVETRG